MAAGRVFWTLRSSQPVRRPLTSIPPHSEAIGTPAAATDGFVLRVRDGHGKAQRLEIRAASEADALRKAIARGQQVLAIERADRAPSSRERGGQFPLILFTQELLALLDAGLNLTEAIDTLMAKEHRKESRRVIEAVQRQLHQGHKLSDAMAAQPAQFPPVYVATVRASERTGDLSQALARYVAYQLQFDALRKKLIAASIYPVILLVVGVLVSLFLLGYVVPSFSMLFESSSNELPWLSGRLIRFGQLVQAHQGMALSIVAAVAALALAVGLHPTGRATVVRTVLGMPLLRARAAEFRLARLYRALSLLLASGIPLNRALTMVDGLLPAAEAAALLQVRRGVEQGRSLSESLKSAGLSSPVADSLIRVGEQSGQLASMLERTARFSDETFGRWVDLTSRLLEPALMVLIGGVIGTVVVLMYMPIFEIAGTLK